MRNILIIDLCFRGFAFKTINQRLPVILTKIIDQLSRDKKEISESYNVVRYKYKLLLYNKVFLMLSLCNGS